MHYTGNLEGSLRDANKLGYTEIPEKKPGEHYQHDWNKMVSDIQMYIKKLNFMYRTGLRNGGVEYEHAWGSFDPEAGPHTVKLTNKKGEVRTITAKNVLVATGGRPRILDIPGALEYGITSDDLFSLRTPPGKTLVVGSRYIALECAGFLTELGFDTTVAVRSDKVLKNFDQDMANKVKSVMQELGTKFLMETEPASLTKSDSEGSRITVNFEDGTSDDFDTVLFATGRTAATANLGLPSEAFASPTSSKLVIDEKNLVRGTPCVYAVGDVVKGIPELTPVAIKAGELLADRLFGGKTKLMDYHSIPTTVFTPAEYSHVGMSEEEALTEYSKDEVECYMYSWGSLELSVTHRPKVPSTMANEFDEEMSPNCMCKIVVHEPDEKVLGFHYIGPAAGEVIHGFAVAFKMGMTKSQVEDIVGVHPTDCEAVIQQMHITKSSGENYVATGGCGGGKCG
ncbi:hypothetical protein FOZ62_000182 [Perkinsus olseni]|uniref:thioredoxin-disulfide reductase (NADPH) n=1 Tax=Perkinsus olseni TaxID=32597 RepID=A0A7J6R5Q8_PEROL|nr:hypothetical protein FOZ62_000182 [Perkinsus olseni]